MIAVTVVSWTKRVFISFASTQGGGGVVVLGLWLLFNDSSQCHDLQEKL